MLSLHWRERERERGDIQRERERERERVKQREKVWSKSSFNTKIKTFKILASQRNHLQMIRTPLLSAVFTFSDITLKGCCGFKLYLMEATSKFKPLSDTEIQHLFKSGSGLEMFTSFNLIHSGGVR